MALKLLEGFKEQAKETAGNLLGGMEKPIKSGLKLLQGFTQPRKPQDLTLQDLTPRKFTEMQPQTFEVVDNKTTIKPKQEVKELSINLDPISQIESSKNPKAFNKGSQARGLHQITPIVVKEWNNYNPKEKYTNEDMFDPKINTKVADWYMNKRIPQMLKAYNIEDNTENRLWAYNAGIGKVRKGIKPKETVDYINKFNILQRDKSSLEVKSKNIKQPKLLEGFQGKKQTVPELRATPFGQFETLPTPKQVQKNKARAVVELGYRERGEKVPTSTKIQWAIEDLQPIVEEVGTTGGLVATGLVGGVFSMVRLAYNALKNSLISRAKGEKPSIRGAITDRKVVQEFKPFKKLGQNKAFEKTIRKGLTIFTELAPIPDMIKPTIKEAVQQVTGQGALNAAESIADLAIMIKIASMFDITKQAFREVLKQQELNIAQKDITQQLQQVGKFSNQEAQQVADFLIKQGNSKGIWNKEYVNAIRKKALKDFWKKRFNLNQSGFARGGKLPKPKPEDIKQLAKGAGSEIVKGVSESLLQEARKYKTAEEFVESQKLEKSRDETVTKKGLELRKSQLTDIWNQANAKEVKPTKKIIEKQIKPKPKKVPIKQVSFEVASERAKVKEKNIKNTVLENIKKQLKTSKPLVKTSYPVGRYDYENNMLFKDLREYNKLTKEQAREKLAEIIPNITSETDKIRARMLSVKADGKLKTSTEMYQRLLDDIKEAKRIGLQAKNDQEFEKIFNRQQDVIEFVNSVSRISGNKGTIMNAIANMYRQGFGDMYSVLNSIAGKNIAEKYNMEVIEDAKRTNIYFKYKDSIDSGIRAYGLKNKRELNSKFSQMSNDKFKIVDIVDGLEKEITRFDLIDIYNSIKNESTKKLYYEGYGEGQINSLLQNLTQQDRVFADILQKQVQQYWDLLNDKAIDLRGYELGRVDNYWMRTSELQPQDFDSFSRPSEVPSAMKQRARKVLPVPKNAWVKYQKYINQAEHVLNVSDSYENLKKILNDRKTKNAIENKFGENIFRHLNKQVDNLSLSKNWEEMNYFENVAGKALNNWVRAKVASPSVFLKQLISMGNYSERMPIAEWTKGFFEGIAKPRETARYMNKIAPFLEARFKRGYSEAVERAVREAEKAGAAKETWSNFLTILPRTGDIGAIIYGGYPLVKYAMKPKSQGGLGMTEKQAANLFYKETLRSQQSSNLASKSEFQNSRNVFARMFYAFKNTPNQYLRKNVNAVISYLNGDETAGQTAKTLIIYSVIQPALYAFVGTLVGGILLGKFKDEDKEKIKDTIFRDILEQLAVAPFTAAPFINDIVSASVRKAIGKKVWRIFNTPMVNDLEIAIRKLQKKNVTAEDLFYAVQVGTELSTGIPALGIERYAKGALKTFGLDKTDTKLKKSKFVIPRKKFATRRNKFTSRKITFKPRKNIFRG